MTCYVRRTVFFLFLLLAGLAVRPASADPLDFTFAFTFNPSTYTSSVPNFTLDLMTTVTNTGTTAIDSFDGGVILNSPTYVTSSGFGPDPNISSSHPLNPGQSITWDFWNMTFSGIPPGTYFDNTFVSAAEVGLDNASGMGAVDSSNLPTLIVGTTVPEPSALLLMATGAVGLLGMVRRRYSRRGVAGVAQRV